MSKITRISAALALVVAVVSGCKSNNNTCPTDGGVAAGGCGCGANGGVVTSGMGGAPITTSTPVGMSPTITSGSMGSAMPTGTPSRVLGGR